MVKSTLLLSLAGLSTLIDARPLKLRAASGKRGLAYNVGSLTKLFGASNGQVSWMYNWGSATSEAAQDLEYVPMLHGNDADHTGSWDADVKTAVDNGATHIMSFNEPDQCGENTGGSCITDIATAAADHKKYVQPLASKYPNLKIGAPAVTNGVQSDSGTKMGLPYLKDFLDQCSDCQIDFICVHWYDAASNFEYFKKHLQDAHELAGNKPVWLTEFGATGDAEGFLKQAIPWLDSQDWIERYAYQWTAPGSLVNDASNGLSSLGSIYASA